MICELKYFRDSECNCIANYKEVQAKCIAEGKKVKIEGKDVDLLCLNKNYEVKSSVV